jgi:hypothetical protein
MSSVSSSSNSPTESPTDLPAGKVIFYIGAGSMSEENRLKFTPQPSPPPRLRIPPSSNLGTNIPLHP